MKKIIAIILTVFLLLGIVSCKPVVEETPVVMGPLPTPVVIEMSDTAKPTQVATPVPTLSPTPVPSIDEPWYKERNELITGYLKQYNPALSDDEVASRVSAMYIDPSKPMVALTFDDGPFLGVTDRILDILERYNVRATFFVCGWRYKDEAAKDITRRALTLGCEIGNHTYAHNDMATHTESENLQSIKRNEEIVFEFTGYKMHGIRPPGGHNVYEANSYAKKNGQAVILWAQSGNVHETDPAKIAQNVEKQIVNGKELQDGDIILLHDTKPYMVDAVEIIVPMLLEKGYQLVTVWELLNCSDDGFVAGETYHKQNDNK